MSEAKLNKAQRLALAGAVAPVLRAKAATLTRRVVKVYDQKADPEARTSVREISGVDAAKGLLASAMIELDIDENSAPPTQKTCKLCGNVLVAAKKKGAPAKTCEACLERFSRCGGCSSRPECERRPTPKALRMALWTTRRSKRRNEPWRCQSCARIHKVEQEGTLRRRAHDVTCAGYRGVPCSKVASKNSRLPLDGEPWRCLACTTRHRRLSAEAQIFCAGRDATGNPCKVVLPSSARTKQKVAKRRGRMWVCKECRPRQKQTGSPAKVAKVCMHCARSFAARTGQQYTCPQGCPCVVPGCGGTVRVDRAKSHAKKGTRAMCLPCWEAYVQTDEYRELCAKRKRDEWAGRSDADREAIFSKTKSHWTEERRAQARAKSVARARKG